MVYMRSINIYTAMIFRAKKRIDGEDVYGSRILCNFGSVKNFEKEGSPRVDNTGKHIVRTKVVTYA